GVDPAAHMLVFDDGREMSYQKVLIATGGRNRRLARPGAGAPGVFYLRTVAECDAMKDEAMAGRSAVVVGMGFIGCEVGAALTQLGVHVTCLFPGRNPLERVLGEQIGELIDTIPPSHGVRMLAGANVAAFDGAGRVNAVVTAVGDRVPCDFA